MLTDVELFDVDTEDGSPHLLLSIISPTTRHAIASFMLDLKAVINTFINANTSHSVWKTVAGLVKILCNQDTF